MALILDDPNSLGGTPITETSYTTNSGNLFVELRRLTVSPGIRWFWTRVTWQIQGFGALVNPILEINGTSVGLGWISSPQPNPKDQWTTKAVGFDMTSPNAPREFSGWYGGGDPTYPPSSVGFSVSARDLQVDL